MSKTERIEFDGHTFYRQGHYFYAHITISLHRYRWSKAHGPIPEGAIIHHSDGNPLNNDVANLECVTPKLHAKHHWGDSPKIEKPCGFCGKPFLVFAKLA